MLAPKQRVHRQLDLVRRPTLLLADQLVLRLGQPQRQRVGESGERDLHRHHAAIIIELKIFNPSVEPPTSRSTACSGCGIKPNTFPASLLTPAMACSEPLKFSPAAYRSTIWPDSSIAASVRSSA